VSLFSGSAVKENSVLIAEVPALPERKRWWQRWSAFANQQISRTCLTRWQLSAFPVISVMACGVSS